MVIARFGVGSRDAMMATYRFLWRLHPPLSGPDEVKGGWITLAQLASWQIVIYRAIKR